MPVVIDASIFVTVCLIVGLGLFVAFEEARQLHGHHTATAVRDMAAVAVGVLMALAAGAFWLSMALP
jgi:hypothetical protein